MVPTWRGSSRILSGMAAGSFTRAGFGYARAIAIQSGSGGFRSTVVTSSPIFTRIDSASLSLPFGNVRTDPLLVIMLISTSADWPVGEKVFVE